MTDAITAFRGQHAFLSNFHRCPVPYELIEYPSAEHAYQAAKTHDIAERMKIGMLPSPSDAKRAGRRLELRPDWEQVKVLVMREIVCNKFEDYDLATLLLATYPAELVEGNTWGDTFWGVCNGRGENWLGRVLMEVRDVLLERFRVAQSPFAQYTRFLRHAAGETHVGLRRPNNQDSFLCRPDLGVYAVADGVGGNPGGEIASGVACLTLLHNRAEPLIDIVHKANERLKEARPLGMATTFTAVRIAGNRAEIVHVGDSRFYLWRDGQLYQGTADHTITGQLLAMGQITSAEARVHGYRNVLLQALGKSKIEPQCVGFEIQSGDRLLLCTDGLHGYVRDVEIGRVLATNDTPAKAVASLVQLGLAAGGKDNVTAIVIDCPGGAT